MNLRNFILVISIPVIAILFGWAIPDFPAGIMIGIWLANMYEFIHDAGD